MHLWLQGFPLRHTQNPHLNVLLQLLFLLPEMISLSRYPLQVLHHTLVLKLILGWQITQPGRIYNTLWLYPQYVTVCHSMSQYVTVYPQHISVYHSISPAYLSTSQYIPSISQYITVSPQHISVHHSISPAYLSISQYLPSISQYITVYHSISPAYLSTSQYIPSTLQ